MSFFKSVVLSYIVKVISANNDGPLHFHFDDNSTKYSASDLDCASEGAFFVNIFTFLSFSRSLKSKTNFLNIPQWSARFNARFSIEKSNWLLLKSTLGLQKGTNIDTKTINQHIKL